MSPRPAPDLAGRRLDVLRAARSVAEADGWPAVTMRRLASDLGVTQPVLYTVFDGRQALLDAVALDGFDALARALEESGDRPVARMRAYLDFAARNPRVYEAMFSLPTALPFGADDVPAPLRLAFSALRAAFPDADGTRAELAWSMLHGIASLAARGRLPAGGAAARVELAGRMLASDDG